MSCSTSQSRVSNLFIFTGRASCPCPSSGYVFFESSGNMSTELSSAHKGTKQQNHLVIIFNSILKGLQQVFGVDIGLIICKMLQWLQIGCHPNAIHRQMLCTHSRYRFHYHSTGYTIWRGRIDWPQEFVCIAKDTDTIVKCAEERAKRNDAMSRMTTSYLQKEATLYYSRIFLQ